MSELDDFMLTAIKDAIITDIAPRHLRMMAAELLKARKMIKSLKDNVADLQNALDMI